MAPSRMWLGRLLACTVTLATGCGTSFVDPHPAEIEPLRWQYSLQPVFEPLVYALVMDLHIVSTEQCESARRTLEDQLSLALEVVPDAHKLVTQDLSPGCSQGPSRAVDVEAFEAQLSLLTRQNSGAKIRPVFVYVNNVELDLPASLRDSWQALKERSLLNGTLFPELWVVGTSAAIVQLPTDASVFWTHSGDEAMARELNLHAQLHLPFATLAPPPTQVPLLDPGQLSRTRMLKVCALWGPGEPGNFTPGGVAEDVRLTAPPLVKIQAFGYEAASRSVAYGGDIIVEGELCTANCDRFIEKADQRFVRWTEAWGCTVAPTGVLF